MSRARERADGSFGDLDITDVGSIQLDSISGDSDTNTSITFSGSDVITVATGGSTSFTANADQTISFSEDIKFPDSKKALFGASSDLQIFHDGSNSKIETAIGSAGDLYIASQRSGSDLYLRAEHDIKIQPQGGENGIVVQGDGGVVIYHDNGFKLETDAQGANISGTLDVSSKITVAGGTDATTTSDGSISTAGGLSVTKDTVMGDDLKMLSDGAVIHFGADSEVTLTHVADTGLTLRAEGTADTLSIVSGDDGTAAGPTLELRRDSASPADNDGVGSIVWTGRNDNSQDFQAAVIKSQTSDVSDGTEDSFLYFRTMHAGSETEHMAFLTTETVFNDPSNDIDFRVESDDNTHMLFVEAGENRVGIGTNAPDKDLHVEGSDGSGEIRIENSAHLVRLDLQALQTTAVVRTVGSHSLILQTAQTEAMRIDSSQNVGIGTSTPSQKLSVAGHMDISATSRFYLDGGGNTFISEVSADAIAFTTNNSERMRIDSSGVVNVGTTTAVSGATAVSAHGISSFQNAGNYGVNINRQTNDGAAINFRRGGNDRGSISVHGSTGSGGIGINGETKIQFFANDTEKFRLGETYAIIGDDMTNNNNQALQLYESGSNINIMKATHSHASNTEGIRVHYNGGSPDDANGNFYDAFDTTANRFAVRNDGDVVNHDNSYGAISDERIKQDIKDANSQWNDIKNIKIRNYKKKDDVRQYGDNAWEQIGVIAQELETVSPKLIKNNKPTSSDIKSNSAFGTLWTVDDQEVKDGDANEGEVKEVKEQVKSVKYSVLYMKAIKALQEAMERIETLEQEVKELKG